LLRFVIRSGAENDITEQARSAELIVIRSREAGTNNYLLAYDYINFALKIILIISVLLYIVFFNSKISKIL
jgi:hypothetical protein